jgi:hypothetical protein
LFPGTCNRPNAFNIRREMGGGEEEDDDKPVVASIQFKSYAFYKNFQNHFRSNK